MKFLAHLYDLLFAPAGVFDSDSSVICTSEDNSVVWPVESDNFMVNPATGLPMLGGIGSTDVMGNLFGFDGTCHDDCASTFDHFESASMFDTSSTFDTSSMFDCGFSSTGTDSCDW